MRIGNTRRKPALVPLCPPQISLDPTWIRIRAATAGRQRQPKLWHGPRLLASNGFQVVTPVAMKSYAFLYISQCSQVKVTHKQVCRERSTAFSDKILDRPTQWYVNSEVVFTISRHGLHLQTKINWTSVDRGRSSGACPHKLRKEPSEIRLPGKPRTWYPGENCMASSAETFANETIPSADASSSEEQWLRAASVFLCWFSRANGRGRFP
jgi:hypothetical protein